MPKITVLDQHLVNKIAAGEVVERPASVVKELLENSLDAGAKSLRIEIEEGGRKLIRVSDDGSGMDRDDILLAVHPHATSKIATDDDLFAINTLGFRGEAMASVASVSHMTIDSRCSDDIQGWRLEIEGGQIIDPTPIATSVGTVTTIRNLFFNTPARRKFLKTTNTEMGHINEQVTRIALAHIHAQFTLINNGRKVFELPANQSLHERVGTLFSSDLTNQLMSISREDHGIKISGMIAPPQQSRANAQWQYIFLNGRYIRDKFIGHAIKEAYRGLLEIRRQPIVFLFLQVDPSTVDVNVHPTKVEVRFSDSNRIHSQVLAAIRDKLLSTDLTVKLNGHDLSTGDGRGGTSPESESADPTQRKENVRQAMADFFKNKPPQTETIKYNAPSTPSTWQPSSQPSPARIDFTPQGNTGDTKIAVLSNNENNTDTDQSEILFSESDNDSIAGESQPDTNSTDQTPTTPYNTNGFLQVHNSYIVEQSEDGLAIIDQHALHERILYEQLNTQLHDGPLESQRFLIPEVVDVTPSQMAAIDSQAESLRDLGVIVEQFGPQTVAIQGFPTLLEKTSPTTFVGDLLDILVEKSGKVTREELMHSVLDMMACKAAVKAGDFLNEHEIKALLSRRHEVERSSNCPHGRPTTIKLSMTELAKLFKRT